LKELTANLPEPIAQWLAKGHSDWPSHFHEAQIAPESLTIFSRLFSEPIQNRFGASLGSVKRDYQLFIVGQGRVL
jgi:hypothetical protein